MSTILNECCFKMLRLTLILALFGVVLGIPTEQAAPRLDGRIVGGQETSIEYHPYQVALLYFNRHFCGGVLIKPQFVLTAAHCLEGAIVSNLGIRAGSTIRSSGGQIVDVARFHIHPDYNRRTVDYDFAVLVLVESVSVQTAALVALPEPNHPVIEGDTAFITGWGLLSPDGISPEILHVAQVPVIGQERCQRAYVGNTITPRMFCTGRLGVGGIDACQGDGGGPVIVGGRLAGLVSWGTGCASADYPGVNSYVAAVLEWIYDNSEL